MSEPITIFITVRESCSTYHARCAAQGTTGSSANTARLAVLRAALKAFDKMALACNLTRPHQREIFLKLHADGVWLASWCRPAQPGKEAPHD